MVEFLLMGVSGYQYANEGWLREGSASHLARIHTVRNRAQLKAWIVAQAAVPGGGNPIGIHVWNDFPASVLGANRTIDYYPFFKLAVRYLVDPEGHGGTVEDLVALHEELGRGVPLPAAFEAIGISLASFEASYFDLMRAYLPGQAP